MTTIDRTDACDMEFAAVLDRLEAAPVCEEAAIERVARAIYHEGAYCGDCSYDHWGACSECCRFARYYARAAVVALKGTDTAGVVQRVLDLADELDGEAARAISDPVRREAAARIRTAVAGSRPDDSEAGR